jgi:adenine-specific DNA methylase
MRVKTALQLINRFLAEDDFDHDTQFCLHWFEQQNWATEPPRESRRLVGLSQAAMANACC